MKVLALLFIGILTASAFAGEQKEIRTIAVTLSSLRPEAAITAIAQKTKSLKGRVETMDEQTLTLRIDKAQLGALKEELARNGYIADQAESVSNVSAQIIDIKARIESKQTYIAKVNELLNTTGVQDTLEMERALMEAVLALDELKGQLKALERDTGTVSVTITVNPQMNSGNERSLKWSRWQWINELGVRQQISAGEVVP